MFSPRLSRFLPRLTVPLPALPDVHLSAQREVQVKPPCATPAWGAWSHPTTTPLTGDGDVVGVVTLLVRGVAQVLHGDQVVELSVQLEVQEREEEGALAFMLR